MLYRGQKGVDIFTSGIIIMDWSGIKLKLLNDEFIYYEHAALRFKKH